MKIFLVLIFSKLIFCERILIGNLTKICSKRHEEGIYSMRILSDGSLATASSDNTIKFWNLTDGRILKSVSYSKIDHENLEHSFLRSPHWYLDINQLKSNGDLVISTYDQKTFIVDFQTKKFKERLKWYNTGFSLFDISKNGSLITVNSFTDIIYVWNMSSTPKRVIKEINTNMAVKFLNFYNENKVVVASEDGVIQMFNLTSGELLNRISIPNELVYSILVLPQEKLAVCTYKFIYVFNTTNSSIIFKLKNEDVYSITTMILLKDGNLVSGSSEGIKEWDLKSGLLKKSIKSQIRISRLVELSNGNLVSSSFNGELHEWDIKNEKLVRELDGNREDLSDVKSLLNNIESKHHEKILYEWNLSLKNSVLKHYDNFNDKTVYLNIAKNENGDYLKSIQIFKNY